MAGGSSSAPGVGSATARALALPEILRAVFSLIDDNYNYDPAIPTVIGDRAAVLARCCRVSRLWHDGASPLLRDERSEYSGIDDYPDLLSAFSEIPDDPPRKRQRYANFIEDAYLVNVEAGPSAEVDPDLLAGLAFPRLKSVLMRLDDSVASSARWGGRPGLHDGWYIPRIGPNRVERLSLDPRHEINPEVFGVYPGEWKEILVQIVVCVIYELSRGLPKAVSFIMLCILLT